MCLSQTRTKIPMSFSCLLYLMLNVYQRSQVFIVTEPSLSWLYGSWIYNYLCNQCLSPLKLWVWIPLRRGVLDTSLCDKFCQWLVTSLWFSPGTPVSSTNKTDGHNITEILLKVALNTITLTLHLITLSYFALICHMEAIFCWEFNMGWWILVFYPKQ